MSGGVVMAKIDAFRRQYARLSFEDDFLIPLQDWCILHLDRVSACYIPMPGGHIQVFIVTNSRQFDLDLGVEMAELELNLARRGWRVGVSQLPDTEDESLATFFNADEALEVYAQRGPTPAPKTS
jgi:hypothetical protein